MGLGAAQLPCALPLLEKVDGEILLALPSVSKGSEVQRFLSSDGRRILSATLMNGLASFPP